MRTVLLLAALALPLVAEDRPAKPTDEEAKKKVEALQDAVKARDNEAVLAAIRACANCGHPTVVVALAPILVSGEDDTRLAAAKSLGTMPGLAEAAKALHGALKTNEKRDKVLKELFTSIARVNHPSSVAFCKAWIDDRLDLRDSDEVPGVIHALDVLGFLKWKSSVEALLDLVHKKIVSGENAGSGGGFKAKCGAHAEASLRRLTGQEGFGDLKLWQDWWKKHDGEFNEDMTRRK